MKQIRNKIWILAVALVLACFWQTIIPVEAGNTKTVTGTMYDATMNSVSIHTAAGKDIIFVKAQNVKLGNGKHSIVIGDKIKITYKESAKIKKAVKISLAKKAKQIIGYVQDGTSMNVLELKTSKGKKYEFTKQNAYADTIDGLTIGDKVCVYYYKKGVAVMIEELKI